MNIFGYIEQYNYLTFKEKEFNEIDNLVFSTLIYLDYTNLITKKENTIGEVGKKYLATHAYKDVASLGIGQKQAYKLLEIVINSIRYKDIKMKDYQYIVSEKGQFSAVKFRIKRNLAYISFEGTDEFVSGWKEDFQLVYMYPIPSQIHAIDYINKHINLFGPNIIVGGHSKGGNLAVVGSMESKWYNRVKIKKIYSNDGPGLKETEFESKKYKKVKDKLIHIIPYNSTVGVMLKNDNYKVVKSTRRTILSHDLTTWVIEDDKLVETERSKKSIDLEESVLNWLKNHNHEVRKNVIENLFNVLEENGITDIRNVTNFKNFIKIVKGLKNLDDETKSLTIDFLNYNIFKLRSNKD